MIEMQKRVHENLCLALTDELDLYMNEFDFTRGKRSLSYSRPCDAGRQLLQMHFNIHPRIEFGAETHIYPWINFVFPYVNRVALKMVSQEVLPRDPDITLAQPMEFGVPKESRVRWFTYGGDVDYVLCVRSIRGYLEKWVIPFLNDYKTIDALANYYDLKDDRIPSQRRLYIYLAAGFVLLGNPTKAMEVLEAKFGKAAPRRQYAAAFDFVKQQCNQQMLP